MEVLFNILTNFLIYISIPVGIRYAILRRPIENKWIAMAILVPIFIGFATLIGVQREEGQKRISQQLGIPYRSTPHMIGSSFLYGAIIVSYFILRRGRKQMETVSEKPTAPTSNTTNRPTTCSKCKAETSIDSVYCHKCGNNLAEGNKA
jgi:ribosomal protein L40E